ncbi:MAG: PHP domain-containing protein [Bacillota bacterium]
MERYKYETHLHTKESSWCARVPAVEAVRMYHHYGYTGIIVTDHYFRGFFETMPFGNWERKIDCFLSGYRKALNEGGKIGLDVCLGMEIRFDENDNDYLVYGIDEAFLKENRKLYRLTLEEFKGFVAGKGIAVVQAHPFRPGMIPAQPSLLDAVEAFNGNPRQESQNHLAFEYAVQNGLKMLSGTDFHRVEDAFRGGVATEEKINLGEFGLLILQNYPMELIQADMA